MVDIVQVGLSVDSKQVDKGTKSLDKLGKQGKKTETATNKMSKSFKLLGAAIAAVGVIALTKSLIDQINKYTALSNKLKLVTTDAKNLADVQQMLFDVAQDTRGSLEGTIDLYSRLARSTKDLELSQNDLADVTETINKAIAVSGSTATEASAAIFQLGQGLAAGALRGEELNSVMEQTPRLAQAMADGLGIGIAQLRVMGSEGKLNSEVVIKALQNQASTIAYEFSQTEKTISQAFQQIENVALKTFGSIKGGGLVEAMDAFRDVISDPQVIEGLQTIAELLLKAVTAAVKLTAALPRFGESLGKSIANFFAPDPIIHNIEKIKEAIAISETAGDGEDLAAKAKTDRKRVELERIAEMEAEAEFDRVIKQQEDMERLSDYNDKKLELQMDYYDRLYNMEAGSQQAALNFSDAIRRNDARSALQNGALMLANAAKTNKAAFEVQKAFALANAIVTLPSAVMKSFDNGGGYPWGLVPAGLMLAQGLQQINSIRSTSFGGGGAPASVGGSTSSSAPVASGLPEGSTAVPDASEQPQTQITLNIEPNALLTGQVLIDTLEELGDNGMLNGVLA